MQYEILSPEGKSEVIGTDDHNRGPGIHRGATQDPIGSDVLGPRSQKSTRADFPILSSLTPTTPVRRRSHTDNYLRDSGYCKRTRKRMLRAAQRGMLRVIMQTKKKIQNQEGNWRKRHL